jgi:hypothetical protein
VGWDISTGWKQSDTRPIFCGPKSVPASGLTWEANGVFPSRTVLGSRHTFVDTTEPEKEERKNLSSGPQDTFRPELMKERVSGSGSASACS